MKQSSASITQRFAGLRWVPYALLSLCALFWSGNWVVARALRHDVPPVGMAFWRWLIALAILIPFAYPHVRAQWVQIVRAWKVVAGLGLLGTGLYNVLGYLGMRYTTATNGALLNSMIPVLIIVLSYLFLGERISARQGAGVALSLAGVLCIVSRADLSVIAALNLNIGDVWVLTAMTSWAAYTIVLKWRPQQVHPLALLTVSAAVGLAVMTPAYMWELASGLRLNIGLAALSGLGYLALFPAVLAFVFWNHAVEQIGANKAGLFLHLVPGFGSLLSIVLLGESAHLYHLAGILLILVGVYFSTYDKARTK